MAKLLPYDRPDEPIQKNIGGGVQARKDARLAEPKYDRPHVDPREDQTIKPHNI